MCMSLFKDKLNMLRILFLEFLLEESTAVLILAKLMNLRHKTIKAYVGKSITY